MKTIKQWLEELPEPYRTQALENYDENYLNKIIEIKDCLDALRFAFDWSNTSQGFNYWQSFYGDFYIKKYGIKY